MDQYETSAHLPHVIESGLNGERAYDIYSRLLKERIVFCTGMVEPKMANAIIAQLLFLETNDPNENIRLYINTPGGHVRAGLAIYDTMQLIRPKVSTICIGEASSMGAVLLAAGEKGERCALPNSSIMIHQPSGGYRGQVTDIQIHAAEVTRIKTRMNKIMAHHTGQKLKTVTDDMERDFFMDAEEAMKYGIVDRIIGS